MTRRSGPRSAPSWARQGCTPQSGSCRGSSGVAACCVSQHPYKRRAASNSSKEDPDEQSRSNARQKRQFGSSKRPEPEVRPWPHIHRVHETRPTDRVNSISASRLTACETWEACGVRADKSIAEHAEASLPQVTSHVGEHESPLALIKTASTAHSHRFTVNVPASRSACACSSNSFAPGRRSSGW